MRIRLAMAVLSALVIPGWAYAQSVTGSIEGRIREATSDNPVELVQITVSGPNLQLPLTTVSRSDGYFTVKEIPVGLCSVSIQRVGYRKVTYDDVDIQLGRTTSLGAVPLSMAAAMMDTLVVVAQKPVIDFSSTEVGDNLTAEVLDRLPTPRDYREAVIYVPQATDTFLGDATNIAGSTGQENQYFIDGANVTEPVWGSYGARLPQNFVREIQVKEGGYEAEYGKATGGIINVITHSGSNEFKGQAFGFFSNNSLSAKVNRDPDLYEQGGFNSYDIGASFGGPVVHDRLWYFAAYNPTVQSESLVIPGHGSFDDKFVSHLFAGKLTWSPDAKTTLDLVTFGDPTHHDVVGWSWRELANPDPLLRKETTGAIAANLSGHRRFGDNVLVNASVSRVETSNESKAATEIGRTEATYYDYYNGVISGGTPAYNDYQAVRWTTDVSATIFMGRHEVKVGAAYENILLDEEERLHTPDGGPGMVVRRNENTWQTSLVLNDFKVSHRVPSVFAQDSWRITDRLRVNAGVRWDGIYIVNSEGDVAQSVTDGLSPRAGVTYQLDRSGRQKVSGSYGRFYEQFPLIASSFYYGEFYQRLDTYDEDPLSNPAATPVQSIELDQSTLSSDNFNGQYLDEFTLGYERQMGEAWKVGVRGIYRNLGEAIENSLVPGTSDNVVLGNPGKGSLTHMPDPVHRYTGVEFSVENTFGRKLHLASSYVLSRSYGNYQGVYNTDALNGNAHTSNQFLIPEQISEGLLNNDRPHVFKVYGSYAFDFGMTAGWFFTWQSGIPLLDLGATQYSSWGVYTHLVPRGKAGRTPSIWDANLRLSYDLSRLTGNLGGSRSRLHLDIFHLFGQREELDYDLLHYFGVDQTNPNPNYLRPYEWQPPMTVRLGIETLF